MHGGHVMNTTGENANKVGENIKLFRKEFSLTQKAFAARVGINHNFLSLVEHGHKRLSDKNIATICHVFNLNKTWLRFGSGNMFIGEGVKINAPETLYEKVIEGSLDAKQQDLNLERLRNTIISAVSSANSCELKAIQSFLNKIITHNN